MNFLESNENAKDFIRSKLNEIDTEFQGETNQPMTSFDHDHHHGYEVDQYGKGRTVTVNPLEFPKHHVHEIIEWKVMPAGEDQHSHTIYEAGVRKKK